MFNISRLSHLFHTVLRHEPPFSVDVLYPLRQWLNQLDVCHPDRARLICQVIPAQCPFEREIQTGRFRVTIPPLCKLNPPMKKL